MLGNLIAVIALKDMMLYKCLLAVNNHDNVTFMALVCPKGWYTLSPKRSNEFDMIWLLIHWTGYGFKGQW